MVGAFGEFVFAVSSSGGQGCTFNALTASQSARVLSHVTVAALPVVEFAGLESERVQLTGVLNEQICADVDDKILELKSLMDGEPRILSRGSRVFGPFLASSLSVTEERWGAGGELLAANYSLTLISTRVLDG